MGGRSGSGTRGFGSERRTFTSRALIKQIAEYIKPWNADPKPFTWVATADEILAKVKIVEADVAG